MATVSETYERGMTELHRETVSYDETVRFSAIQHGFVVEVEDGYVKVECEGVTQEVEPGKKWKFVDLESDMPEVKLSVGGGDPIVLFTF